MLELYIVIKAGKEYMYRCTSHYSAEKHAPVSETEYMGVVVDGKLRPKRGYFYDESTKEFAPSRRRRPPPGRPSPVSFPDVRGMPPAFLTIERYGVMSCRSEF